VRLISHPLDWYVGKLERGETFSLARYGDGELYCMLGRDGVNGDGCAYRGDLADALVDSLCHHAPDFHHGLQRVYERDRDHYARILEHIGAGDRDWLDTGVIAHSIIDGEFYPLLDALRGLETVVVSNRDVRAIRGLGILDYTHFVETPASNCWSEVCRVYRDIMAYGRPACYLLSCGMTACVLTSALHGAIPGSWFIDIGHVWDVFLGKHSRYYMAGMTTEQIERNLRPPEGGTP
jgi:hypothetical protein